MLKNNKIPTFIASLAIIIASFIFNAPITVMASDIPTTIEEIRDSISDLLIAKDDDSVSEQEKEKKKVEAAKNTLKKILELGLLEIKTFKSKLDDLNIGDLVVSDYTFDSSDVYDSLDRLLNYYEAFYKDTLKRLQSVKKYEDIQVLAKDIKLWRENTYTPGIQKILALDLVLRNKNIIKIANSRFDKILSDLRKLKNSGLISLSEVERYLADATANLKAAEALDSEITKITLQLLKKQTLNLDNQKKNDSRLIISDYKRINNLVDQSIIKVKEAYKIFIALNSEVKKNLEL